MFTQPPTVRFYDVVGDNISINFSTPGERDRRATLTIEEAEQLILELREKVRLAKEARIKILEEEIDVLNDKQSQVKGELYNKTHSLRNLREELGKAAT